MNQAKNKFYPPIVNTSELCKLCLTDAKLCRSHIIPEFCYSNMYDEKHRLLGLKLSEKKLFMPQKGYRERLLCESCEAVLNKYEKHARRLFTDSLEPTRGSKLILTMPQLDYHMIKLFLLSVVWRAGVSQNPFFAGVELGKHEPKLRSVLLSDRVLPSNLYPCSIWWLHLHKEPIPDLLVEPTFFFWGTNKCYRLIFGGFLFIVIMTSQPVFGIKLKGSIKTNEPPFVLKAEISDIGFLRKFWDDAATVIQELPELE